MVATLRTRKLPHHDVVSVTEFNKYWISCPIIAQDPQICSDEVLLIVVFCEVIWLWQYLGHSYKRRKNLEFSFGVIFAKRFQFCFVNSCFHPKFWWLYNVDFVFLFAWDDEFWNMTADLEFLAWKSKYSLLSRLPLTVQQLCSLDLL